MVNHVDFEIRVISFYPLDGNGGRFGKATFEVWPPGVRLAGALLVQNDRSLGIVFPKRGVMQGEELARDSNGSPQLVRPVSFNDSTAWLRFSEKVIEAINAAYPGALETARAQMSGRKGFSPQRAAGNVQPTVRA